jgi:hypothetical protein
MPRNKLDKDKTFSFSELDIVVYEYRVSEGHLSICDFNKHFESIGQNPSRIKSPKQEVLVPTSRDQDTVYEIDNSTNGDGSFSDSSNVSTSSRSLSSTSLSERATFRLKKLHSIKIE